MKFLLVIFSLILSQIALAEEVPLFLKNEVRSLSNKANGAVGNNPAMECLKVNGFYVKDVTYNLEKINKCILEKAKNLSQDNLKNLATTGVETTVDMTKKSESMFMCLKNSNGVKGFLRCVTPSFLLKYLPL